MNQMRELLPCPFCGGPVDIEKTIDGRKWYGVVCRNTFNRGGSCAVSICPSASEECAIERWNMRAQSAAVPVVGEVIPQDWDGIDGAVAWHLIDRHGEGWSQIGQMMGEWLKANSIDSAKLALLLRCEAALEVLMEECKSSNDCQYGTLSTSHIIGIIDAAIAGETEHG